MGCNASKTQDIKKDRARLRPASDVPATPQLAIQAGNQGNTATASMQLPRPGTSPSIRMGGGAGGAGGGGMSMRGFGGMSYTDRKQREHEDFLSVVQRARKDFIDVSAHSQATPQPLSKTSVDRYKKYHHYLSNTPVTNIGFFSIEPIKSIFMGITERPMPDNNPSTTMGMNTPSTISSGGIGGANTPSNHPSMPSFVSPGTPTSQASLTSGRAVGTPITPNLGGGGSGGSGSSTSGIGSSIGISSSSGSSTGSGSGTSNDPYTQAIEALTQPAIADVSSAQQIIQRSHIIASIVTEIVPLVPPDSLVITCDQFEEDIGDEV